MKIYFASQQNSPLLHPESSVLTLVKLTIREKMLAEETVCPEEADAIIVQETNEYKDFRYIDKLLNDVFINTHLTKIFTISTDDSATGLLRGLYTSMPQKRCDKRFHRSVPFIEFTNKFVFTDDDITEPAFLAGWYGNTRSNKVRNKIFELWAGHPSFSIKKTQSWYNHNEEEKRAYVHLIKNSKFSLCPAGWAPPSPRIYESMALGRCPVIIADEFVKPEGPAWSEFALFLPEKYISKIDVFLKQNECRYEQLGTKAKENWERYFAGDLLSLYYVNTLFELINSTPRYTRAEEVSRWRSSLTYWNNNWSVPQRLISRYNRLVNKF